MIIGVTGTLGAGKGTVAEYLVHKKGFAHYSARAFLTEEIEKRGMEVNRDSMTMVANDLRAKHGPSYIIEELSRKAYEVGGDAVIESVRTVGEVHALKEGGAILLSVDAERRVRYERIQKRQSNTDAVSFEEFVANEEREMTSTDPNKQNIGAVMELADIQLTNNGTIEEFEQQIEEQLLQR